MNPQTIQQNDQRLKPSTTYGGNINVPGSIATTGVAQSNKPIDAQRLGTTPNTQVPPPVTTNTAQQNLGVQTTAFTEGVAGQQQLDQQQAQAQQAITPASSRQGILDKISSLLGVQGTQGQVTQDIYEQEGVFEKKQLVTKLEGEALAKERAYQKQAEKIRQNAEGKLESGVNIDLANLERQKNSELADIAIQYKIASGAYTDANAIAEAKVKAQFEPIENQIKTLQALYGLYQNDLSESEKMEAQAKIQERQAQLDFARQKELLRYKADIELQQKMDEGGAKGLSGTAEQFKAAGFANRVEQSNTILKQLDPKLKSMSQIQFAAALASPSYLQSPQMQQFSQASRNYINAVLRRESGAAIAPEEFKNALKQYIPAPGDSEEVLKQKEQNRLLIQRNYINEASTAYEPLTPDLTPMAGGTGTQASNPSANLTGADFFSSILNNAGTSSIFNPQTGFILPNQQQ